MSVINQSDIEMWHGNIMWFQYVASLFFNERYNTKKHTMFIRKPDGKYSYLDVILFASKDTTIISI